MFNEVLSALQLYLIAFSACWHIRGNFKSIKLNMDHALSENAFHLLGECKSRASVPV
jgi:hypothetical protein